MATRSRTLRFKLLLVGALLIVVGWSVLWFVVATIVDRQVDRATLAASQAGTVLECTDRRVTGFPFRIEVRCGAGSQLMRGMSAGTVGGLTVTALVYDPDRIIAEVRGPVRFEAADSPSILADWKLAHASARLDLSKQTVERLDAEVTDVEFAVGEIPFALAEADVNVRRDPADADALDFALRLRELTPPAAEVPTDLSVRGTLGDGAVLLAGNVDALLAALAGGDVPLTIETATLESGPLKIQAAGRLTVGSDGRLDGRLDLAVAGHEAGLPYVTAMTPAANGAFAAILTEMLNAAPETTIEGAPAKKVSFEIADGQVTIGRFPLKMTLFTIPPVTVAAR